MPSQKNKNETGYDLWSRTYDRYPNPTVAIDDRFFPAVYSGLRGRRVLEVGCGTGRHTLRLLAAGNRVTGVDLSAGMLSRLQEKTSDSNLKLIQGDFLNVEIPGAPFDAIIASLVLEHVADLGQFFAKARALLTSDGAVFLSELHPSRTEAGVFAHFKDEAGREVALESLAHRSQDVRAAAEASGFGVFSEESIAGDQALAASEPKWARYLGKPMIQIWVLRA